MSERESKRNRFKEYLLDIFFPRHVKCIFCGDELDHTSRNDSCSRCLENLPFIKHFCKRCGEPLNREIDGVCLRCHRNNYNFELARSVFEYVNELVFAVHKYKYGGQRFLCEPLAGFLCEYLAQWDISVDIITSVPLFEKKERTRKFNQAKLMAQIVAERFNLPYQDLVIKTLDNPSQTTLEFKQRQENVKDVYAINKEFKKEIKGKSILLIDDVYTTGATANEISGVLKKGGAKAIYVLTLAHAVIKQEI